MDAAVIFAAGGTGVGEVSRGCLNNDSLGGLPRVPEEVLLGTGVWNPEGRTAIPDQTQREVIYNTSMQLI